MRAMNRLRLRLRFVCLCWIAMIAAVGSVAAADCDSENPAEAIAACSKIIDAGGGDAAARAEAFRNRAFAYLQQEAFKKSLSDYTQAIRLQPGNPVDLYGRGLAYVELNQTRAALIDFARAIAINKDYADAYFERGGIRERAGQYVAALDEYGQAIRSNPEHAAAYNARAWTYYKMRKPARGLRDVDKAIALDPNDLAYYRTRAHILEAMKQRKAAIEAYWRLLRANPLDHEAEAGLMRLRAPRPPAKATGGPKKLR